MFRVLRGLPPEPPRCSVFRVVRGLPDDWAEPLDPPDCSGCGAGFLSSFATTVSSVSCANGRQQPSWLSHVASQPTAKRPAHVHPSTPRVGSGRRRQGCAYQAPRQSAALGLSPLGRLAMPADWRHAGVGAYLLGKACPIVAPIEMDS